MDRKQPTGFWWGDLREQDHLEDLGINRSIILDGQEVGWGLGMD
jgi:hypothetical protein